MPKTLEEKVAFLEKMVQLQGRQLDIQSDNISTLIEIVKTHQEAFKILAK